MGITVELVPALRRVGAIRVCRRAIRRRGQHKGKALTGLGFVEETEDVGVALPAHLVDAGHFALSDAFNRAIGACRLPTDTFSQDLCRSRWCIELVHVVYLGDGRLVSAYVIQ